MTVAFAPKKDVPETEHGPVEYPPDHQPGMAVPQGGSSCAKCKFLGGDGNSCTSEYFIKWNGSDKLPAPADSYCSDWFEPSEEYASGEMNAG